MIRNDCIRSKSVRLLSELYEHVDLSWYDTRITEITRWILWLSGAEWLTKKMAYRRIPCGILIEWIENNKKEINEAYRFVGKTIRGEAVVVGVDRYHSKVLIMMKRPVNRYPDFVEIRRLYGSDEVKVRFSDVTEFVRWANKCARWKA